jgi:hypothetical protein
MASIKYRGRQQGQREETRSAFSEFPMHRRLYRSHYHENSKKPLRIAFTSLRQTHASRKFHYSSLALTSSKPAWLSRFDLHSAAPTVYHPPQRTSNDISSRGRDARQELPASRPVIAVMYLTPIFLALHIAMAAEQRRFMTTEARYYGY